MSKAIALSIAFLLRPLTRCDVPACAAEIMLLHAHFAKDRVWTFPGEFHGLAAGRAIDRLGRAFSGFLLQRRDAFFERIESGGQRRQRFPERQLFEDFQNV